MRLFIKQSSEDIVDELLLVVGTTEEFVLVNIWGSINLKTISKIADEMDIDGLDELKKIDE